MHCVEYLAYSVDEIGWCCHVDKDVYACICESIHATRYRQGRIYGVDSYDVGAQLGDKLRIDAALRTIREGVRDVLILVGDACRILALRAC